MLSIFTIMFPGYVS